MEEYHFKPSMHRFTSKIRERKGINHCVYSKFQSLPSMQPDSVTLSRPRLSRLPINNTADAPPNLHTIQYTVSSPCIFVRIQSKVLPKKLSSILISLNPL